MLSIRDPIFWTMGHHRWAKWTSDYDDAHLQAKIIPINLTWGTQLGASWLTASTKCRMEGQTDRRRQHHCCPFFLWKGRGQKSQLKYWHPVFSFLFSLHDICWKTGWHLECQRAESCIKSITNYPIPGTRKQGRPRETWSECVKTDVSNCGLAGVDPQDRAAWRAGVRHSLVLPIPWNETWTAPYSKTGYG